MELGVWKKALELVEKSSTFCNVPGKSFCLISFLSNGFFSLKEE
jgi:hypothetical protein